MNLVLSSADLSTKIVVNEKDAITRDLKKMFGRPVLGIIPCYCDIRLNGGKSIFALEKRDHPFPKILESVVEKLIKL